MLLVMLTFLPELQPIYWTLLKLLKADVHEGNTVVANTFILKPMG